MGHVGLASRAAYGNAYGNLVRMMLNRFRSIREDLLRTRADRIGLVVLAVLAVAAVALALLGSPWGVWMLLFLGGGLLSTTILAAADRSGQWRRPVMIAGILALPVYLLLSMALTIFAPGLGEPFNPFFPGEEGDLGAPGAFLYGFVMVAAIMGLGRLANSRRSERP